MMGKRKVLLNGPDDYSAGVARHCLAELQSNCTLQYMCQPSSSFDGQTTEDQASYTPMQPEAEATQGR